VSCNTTNVKKVEVPQQGRYFDQVSADIIRTAPTSSPTGRIAPDKHLLTEQSVGEYLDSIVVKLMEQVPMYQGEPPKVNITIDGSYYAASSPSEIVLSTGAILDAESEDEIAYLLAHELSHVLLAHHQTNLYFQKQEAAISTAVNVGIMVNKFRDVSFDSGANQLTQQLSQQSQSNITKAYLSGIAINRLSRDVINSSLSRDDEAEADLLAIDLMTAAGFSPSVAIVSLQRLKSARIYTEQQLKAKQDEFSGFINEIAQNGGNLQKSELGHVGYLIANQAVASFLQSNAERHPEEDARITALAEYLKREYRAERRWPYKTEELDRFKQSTPLLDRYQEAEVALDALLNDDLLKAEQFARQSVAAPTNKDSFTRYVFSMIRDSQSQSDKALQNLDYIADWQTLSVQAFQTSAQIYRVNQRYRDAQRVLDKGIASIGQKDVFYPELIALQRAQENHPQAERLLAQCIEVDAENIIAQCYNQAGYELPPPKDEVEQALDNINAVFSLFD
jgi:predicted Zn-dependent protease